MNDEIIEEKKNNTNKILIAIIIILLLALGGLTYYTFFVRDKEVNKPNPVVEPTKPVKDTNSTTEPTKPVEETDNAESKKPVEEIDYSIDTYEGTYSTYTANTKEIDKIVTELPYSNIINENISHNQLWKTYKVFSIVENLNKTVIGCSESDSVSHKDDIKDSEGVVYPNYTTTEEQVAKDCGLTVSEISKINKELWSLSEGSCNLLYDMDELKTKYSRVYNDMFDKSFRITDNEIYLNNDVSFRGHIYYDHNVNKLVKINSGYGGNPTSTTISIVNKKKENNNYIVEIEEKTTQYDASTPIIVSDNYIITFKLADGYYQFDNIVKK